MTSCTKTRNGERCTLSEYHVIDHVFEAATETAWHGSATRLSPAHVLQIDLRIDCDEQSAAQGMPARVVWCPKQAFNSGLVLLTQGTDTCTCGEAL